MNAIRMFGTYRLFLALIVALSHHGWIFLGFNPGQWSVICFYVLSGLLMDRQFKKLERQGGIRLFYLDRFLRIYPLYLTVLVLGLCIEPKIGWGEVIANGLIFPINYSSLIEVKPVIATACSLALEVHFYLVVPFLAKKSLPVLRVIVGLSLAVFAFSVYLPNSVNWAYTYLPGMLFAFVSGILINRRDWPALKVIYIIIFGLWFVFLLTKIFQCELRSGININVCIGYLVAIPATLYFVRFSPINLADNLVGQLSYPLFLVHPVILSINQFYGCSNFIFLGASIFVSICLVILIEKPFDIIRYAVRKSE